jgi:hypothetical protein
MSDDDFFTNIEDEVKVADAAQVSVYLRYASTAMGTITPAMATTEKVDVPFTVTAITNDDFGFYRWAAFSTSDFSTGSQYANFVYDSDYKTNYAVKELDDSVVKFDDRTSASTTVTILGERNDIWIMPVCANRPTVSLTLPSDNESNIVKNQAIRIIFTKPMNADTFFTSNSDGTTTLSENVVVAEITGALTENPTITDISSKFTKCSLSSSKKILILKLGSGNMMSGSTSIRVTIYKDVTDSDSYGMTSDYTLHFKTNNEEDALAPRIRLMTGGLTDCTSFACTDTAAAVAATKSISDALYTTTLLQTQRTTGKVNIYVYALDLAGSESATSATENDEDDVATISVRASSYLTNQGAESSGSIAETKYTYTSGQNDSNLSGTVSSLIGSSENKGYLFTYDVSSLPDGLIKIDIAANDMAGNEGFDTSATVYTLHSNGYKSLFVVKDTTAPEVSGNDSRITASSSSALGDWYNATTCSTAKFLVMSSSDPILDTSCTKMQPSTMYWRFGSSASSMGSYQVIDQTGSTGYSVSTAIVSPTDGPMPFYVQLKDDLGNASTIVQTSAMSIYYDNTAPNAPTCVTPTSDVYPLQALSSGAANTYYTQNSSISLTITATDPNYVSGGTAASGIAGFLMPTSAYTATELAAALANIDTTNKTLNNLISATWDSTGGYSKFATTSYNSFSAGDTANASSKTYYLYSVDNALNAAGATTITVIQDTTGPKITVTDNATYEYNSSKSYYRTSSSTNDVTTAAATSGGTSGIYSGTYYYNASQSGVPFEVTLSDYGSTYGCGAKNFYIDSTSATTYESASTVTLAAGSHTITALDNIGNKTTTNAFTVAQDAATPSVSSFVMNGKMKDGSSSTTATTNAAVTVSFSAYDAASGVRSIQLTGSTMTFTVPETITIGGTTYSKTTNYTVETGTNTSGANYEIIYLKTPYAPGTAAVSFIIGGITLTSTTGTNTLAGVITDASGNATSGLSATMYCDSAAPSFGTGGVSIESTTGKAVASATVSVDINAYDAISGIKKVYITDSNAMSSEVPSGTSLLTSSSVLSVTTTNGETASLNGTNYFEFTAGHASGSSQTITVTNVSLPSSSTEGSKTIYVYLYDDAGNYTTASEALCSASTIYDKTAPVVSSAAFEGVTNTATGNIFSTSYTGNTLDLKLTETCSGIYTIALSSTGYMKFSTTATTLSVGGSTVDSSKYAISSDGYTLTTTGTSVISGTNIVVKIGGIICSSSSTAATTTVTVTDWATNAPTGNSLSLYVDVWDVYTSTMTLTDEAGKTISATLSDSTTGSVTISAQSGYTNDTSVTMTLAVSERPTTTSLYNSGLRTIKLTGAKFTTGTTVSYTSDNDGTTGNNINSFTDGDTIELSYDSAATSSTYSKTAKTFALSSDGQTLTFVTPAAVDTGYAITFTKVALCESTSSAATASANGSYTVNATVLDMAANGAVTTRTGRSTSSLTKSIIYDGTAPTISDAYQVTSSSRDSGTSKYLIYPRPASNGFISDDSKGVLIDSMRYFYTSISSGSDRLGFNIYDADSGLPSSNTWVSSSNSDVTAAAGSGCTESNTTTVTTFAAGTTYCFNNVWKTLDAAGTTTQASKKYTVYGVDKAGNLSSAMNFTLVHDATAPTTIADASAFSAKDPVEGYDVITGYNNVQQTVSAGGPGATSISPYVATTATAENLFRVTINGGIYLGDHTATTARPQIVVTLPSTYTEENATATAAPIKYWRLSTNAYSSTDCTNYASATDGSYPEYWNEYTPGISSFTMAIPVHAISSDSTGTLGSQIGTSTLYLWLKDACNNISCAAIPSGMSSDSGDTLSASVWGGVWENDSALYAYVKSYNYADGTAVRASDSLAYYNNKASITINGYADHLTAMKYAIVQSDTSTAPYTTVSAVQNEITSWSGYKTGSYYDSSTSALVSTDITLTLPQSNENSKKYLFLYYSAKWGHYKYIALNASQETTTPVTSGGTDYAYGAAQWMYDNTAPAVTLRDTTSYSGTISAMSGTDLKYLVPDNDGKTIYTDTTNKITYFTLRTDGAGTKLTTAGDNTIHTNGTLAPHYQFFDISVAEKGSGINRFGYTLSETAPTADSTAGWGDGGSWSDDTYTPAWSVSSTVNTNLPPGIFNSNTRSASPLYLYIRDTVGNVSHIKLGSTSWKLDSQYPCQVQADTPSTTTYYDTTTGYYLKWTAAATITINIGGASWTSGTKSISLPTDWYPDYASYTSASAYTLGTGAYSFSTTKGDISKASTTLDIPYSADYSSTATNLSCYVYDRVGNFYSVTASITKDSTAPAFTAALGTGSDTTAKMYFSSAPACGTGSYSWASSTSYGTSPSSPALFYTTVASPTLTLSDSADSDIYQTEISYGTVSSGTYTKSTSVKTDTSSSNTIYSTAVTLLPGKLYEICVSDTGGNSTKRYFEVVQDTAKPTLTAAFTDSETAVAKTYTSGGTSSGTATCYVGSSSGTISVSMTGSDSDSGVNTITYVTGSSTTSTTASSLSCPVGTTTFTVTDNVGNTGTYVITVIADTTAPTFTNTTGTTTGIYAKSADTSATSSGSASYFIGTSVTSVPVTFTLEDSAGGIYSITAANNGTVLTVTSGTTTTGSLSSSVTYTCTTGTNTFTLTDHVGNRATYIVTVTQDSTAPTFTFSSASGDNQCVQEAPTSDATSAGTGAYYVMSGKTVTVTLGIADATGGSGIYSVSASNTGATAPAAGATYTAGSMSSITSVSYSLYAGTNTITLTDNCSNKATFTFTVTTDSMAPSVTGAPVAAHTYNSSETNPYYSSGATGNAVTLYSQTTSIGDIALTDASGMGTDTLDGTSTGCGIKGWSSTSATYTLATNVSPTTSSSATVYLFDNVGNYATVSVNLVKDTTGPSATLTSASNYYGTYYDSTTSAVSTASAIYVASTSSSSTTIPSTTGTTGNSYTGYVNSTSPVFTFASITDGVAGLASTYISSTNGTLAQPSTGTATWTDTLALSDSSATAETVTLTDNVGNTTTYSFSLTSDTTAPALSAEIKGHPVDANGSSVDTYYYDITASSGGTIYYQSAGKKIYFDVTGISDTGAGAYWAGLNTSDYLPGNSSGTTYTWDSSDSAVTGSRPRVTVASGATTGTASSVYKTINNTTTSIVLYLYDYVGNEGTVTITCTQDNTAPSTNNNGTTIITVNSASDLTAQSGKASDNALYLNGLAQEVSGVASVKVYDTSNVLLLTGGTISDPTGTKQGDTWYSISVTGMTSGTSLTVGTSYTILYCTIIDNVGNSGTVYVFASSVNNTKTSAKISFTSVSSASTSRFGRVIDGISTIASSAGEAIASTATTAVDTVKRFFNIGTDVDSGTASSGARKAAAKKAAVQKAQAVRKSAVGKNGAAASYAGENNSAVDGAALAKNNTRRDFAGESAGDGTELALAEQNGSGEQNSAAEGEALASTEADTAAAAGDAQTVKARPATAILRLVLAVLALGAAGAIIMGKKRHEEK